MPTTPLRWTDQSLTVGRWGQPPLTLDQRRLVVRTLANWAGKTKQPVAVELYAGTDDDRTLLAEVADAGVLEPVVRTSTKSDALARVAERVVGAPQARVVVDVPVSHQAAGVRFLPHGVERAPDFAARIARDVLLVGLTPEIVLIDIARADKDDVHDVVETVLETNRPHGPAPLWRLVDSSGAADPVGGMALPTVLARWVPWLHYEFGITPDRVWVQAADTQGLALANVLSGQRAGAGVAAPMFGTGMGAGWAPAELVIAHVLGEGGRLKKLLGLRELLAGDNRDEHRPLSGPRAWQFPGGAAPEKPRDELLNASFPVDPRALLSRDPEPLLTSLSGHAGLLHLMHRCWPERHFETDDERALAISAAFEAEFAAGRQEPVSWRELKPKVLAAGLLEDWDDSPGTAKS